MNDEGRDYECCDDCDEREYTYFSFAPDRGNGKCDECHGTGEIDDSLVAGAADFFESVITLGFAEPDTPDTKECPKCYGTGQCQSCGGNGRVKKDDFDDGDEDIEEQETTEGNDDQSYNDNQDDDDTDDDYYSSSVTTYSTPDISPSISTSSNSASANGFIIIVVVAIVAIAIFMLISSRNGLSNGNEGVTPATQQTYIQPPPTAPQNPYGDGNGQLAFYRICPFCKITVYQDTTALGSLPTPPLLVNPQCTDDYMLRVTVVAGVKIFTIKDDEGYVWQDTVQVPNGDCLLVKIVKPDNAIKENDQNPDATNEVSSTNQYSASDFTITSPADYSNYDYPRNTSVEWTLFPNADSYEVELQLSDPPYDYSTTNFTAMPYANGGIYTTSGTSLMVQGMGKQLHRVRVKALISSKEVAITPWRYFNYIN